MPSSLLWPHPTSYAASRVTSACCLIDSLTMLAASTAQDLVRSLTLPSAHAIAQNAGRDHRFTSRSIRDGCCLRRYTGDSTNPIPNSPSDIRPDCMTAPTHSLSVRPEHLPAPPDWVLRLRVGSASTQQVAPLRLTPGYRADRDLPGRGPCTPLEVRVSARDVCPS